MRTWSAVALMSAVMVVLAGCTTQVDGVAQPADGATDPIGVDGDLEDIIPSDDEMIDILGSTYDEGAGTGSSSGDRDSMPDGIRSDETYSPIECLGVTSPGMLLTYEDADVAAFAENSNYGAPLAAIALETREEARELFDTFVEQWQDCDGVSATLFLGEGQDLGYNVVEVDEDDDILTAIFEFGSLPHGSATTYTSRALAQRLNIIVDVEVHGDVPISDAIPENQAVEVAELMLSKISDLS